MQLQVPAATDPITAPRPTEIAMLAWTRLVRTEQTMLARVEEDLKREGFPPLEWYDVLFELDSEPAGVLPQAAVQSRILLAQYNLCRLVDRLQREELVERRPSPDDGRSNLLVITDKGRELRRAMWPTYAAAIEAHLGSRISCAEARALADILGKLTENRQAPPSSAP
jgi:DNA-binding MarR family transcriptional regulator